MSDESVRNPLIDYGSVITHGSSTLAADDLVCEVADVLLNKIGGYFVRCTPHDAALAAVRAVRAHDADIKP